MPKEMLTVVDRPAIHSTSSTRHVKRGNHEHFTFVNRAQQGRLEDHSSDRQFELEVTLNGAQQDGRSEVFSLNRPAFGRNAAKLTPASNRRAGTCAHAVPGARGELVAASRSTRWCSSDVLLHAKAAASRR